MITWFRENLAVIQFYKWYQFLIAFAVAFLSELVYDWLERVLSRRNDSETIGLGKKVRTAFLLFLLYIIICSILLACAVLFYCFAQKNLSLYLKTAEVVVKQYGIELIVIFLTVKILTAFKDHWRTPEKVLLAIILTIVITVSPFLVSYQNDHIGLERAVLNALQEMPYPFAARFYDPDHQLKIAPADDPAASDTSEVQEIPDGTTVGLSFDTLMKNAQICYRQGYNERCQIYVDAAYALYEQGERGTDSFYLGLMWFYKGYFEDSAEYYYRAGQIYEDDSSYNNAALCYIDAYEVEPTELYIERALYSTLHSEDGLPSNYHRLLLSLQSTHSGDIPYLVDLCNKYPDDYITQIVGMTRMVMEGNTDYQSILNRFSVEQSPKLLILNHYLRASEYLSPTYIEVEELYNSEPDLFDVEDKINYAWMLYSDKQYGKAYSVAADAAVGDFDSMEVTMPAEGYLLAAEIYLQDPDVGIDADNLYERLSEISGDIGAWQDDESNLRMNMVLVLLAGKTGHTVDFSSLISNAKELFDGRELSIVQEILLARIDYEDGNYLECANRCRKYLETYPSEIMDLSTRELLFLKTDALIELTKENEELREESLKEAAEDMNKIRYSVEDDYIDSLRRLSDIYTYQGNTEELTKVNAILDAYSN